MITQSAKKARAKAGQDPDWQETIRKESKRPAWLNQTIENLGRKIMTNINAGADVNPVNLLSLGP